jgi:hypothetical protein
MTGEERMPTVAEIHQKRREITGTICLAAQYNKAKFMARDVLSLTVFEGRVFVGEVDMCGNAYSAGVRPGDELVRIIIGQEPPQAPEASPMALRLLATDPRFAGQPATAFFMGFKGRLAAEVQLDNGMIGSRPELPTNLTKLMGDAAFEMLDYARFRPARPPSLFLASRAESCQPDDDISTETGGSEQEIPECELEQRTECDQSDVWHLMELKQQHARLLLAGAMSNITGPSGAELPVWEPRIVSC